MRRISDGPRDVTLERRRALPAGEDVIPAPPAALAVAAPPAVPAPLALIVEPPAIAGPSRQATSPSVDSELLKLITKASSVKRNARICKELTRFKKVLHKVKLLVRSDLKGAELVDKLDDVKIKESARTSITRRLLQLGNEELANSSLPIKNKGHRILLVEATECVIAALIKLRRRGPISQGLLVFRRQNP
jgi:hypothetical protein